MAIVIFKNDDLKVRTFLVNQEPLFIAKDIALCLQYKNTNEAITVHCKKKMLWKNVKKMQDPSVSLPLHPNTILIPESDVYRLILRSKSQNAEVFQDWVCEEVLPALRKKGSYSLTERQIRLDERKRMAQEKELRKTKAQIVARPAYLDGFYFHEMKLAPKPVDEIEKWSACLLTSYIALRKSLQQIKRLNDKPPLVFRRLLNKSSKATGFGKLSISNKPFGHDDYAKIVEEIKIDFSDLI